MVRVRQILLDVDTAYIYNVNTLLSSDSEIRSYTTAMDRQSPQQARMQQ
jgi:hypothetical protein